MCTTLTGDKDVLRCSCQTKAEAHFLEGISKKKQNTILRICRSQTNDLVFVHFPRQRPFMHQRSLSKIQVLVEVDQGNILNDLQAPAAGPFSYLTILQLLLVLHVGVQASRL